MCTLALTHLPIGREQSHILIFFVCFLDCVSSPTKLLLVSSTYCFLLEMGLSRIQTLHTGFHCSTLLQTGIAP